MYFRVIKGRLDLKNKDKTNTIYQGELWSFIVIKKS